MIKSLKTITAEFSPDIVFQISGPESKLILSNEFWLYVKVTKSLLQSELLLQESDCEIIHVYSINVTFSQIFFSMAKIFKWSFGFTHCTRYPVLICPIGHWPESVPFNKRADMYYNENFLLGIILD